MNDQIKHTTIDRDTGLATLTITMTDGRMYGPLTRADVGKLAGLYEVIRRDSDE